MNDIHSNISSPIRLKLDGEALVANWRALAKASGNAQTGAAVKADGYGLGARETVARLGKVGCRDFFVAHWGEAAAIADIIASEQIAVLNGVGGDDVEIARTLGARPILNSPAQIMRWKEAGGGPCHVMLDSGINRLGIGPEQWDASLYDGLDIDILMSHLASADEDVAQNGDQLRRFVNMTAAAPAKRKSLCNSAGIMLGRDYHFDLTRPGISLYGGIQRAELSDIIEQVAFPQAQVLQIRNMPAGSQIGYNATYSAATDIRVATIAIGYADGYYRGFSSRGTCTFSGHELPVIGRVSMDLTIVDASTCPQLGEGDWVSIDYSLKQASETSSMSQYELLTGLGQRFDRIWAG